VKDELLPGFPGTRPRGAKPPLTFAGRCRVVTASVLTVLLLLVSSVLTLLVAVATLFRARRFHADVMARGLARIAFRLYGVRVVQHRPQPLPEGQVVFIGNHWSLLDPFVVSALGLPNCRYFMSGFLRKVLPFGLLAQLCGVFWTMPQTFPERRRRLFQQVDALLRRTGESVYLNPEGQKCWVFNKGAFHLATSLGVPLQPVVIHIPSDVDPGRLADGLSFDIRPGTIHVYFKPPIDTTGWRVEDVEKHRDEVKALYLQWARGLATVSSGPGALAPGRGNG
jgi:1-acyl-sn-glycerol-3-phosphate acyltransferase